MAAKVQINPRVTPETKAQIEQACQERQCSVGELIETAVAAFLEGDGAKGGVMEHLIRLEQQFAALVTLLTPAEPAPEPPPPKIATYEELYGPLDALAPVEPEMVRLSPLTRWQRFWMKESR